MTSPGGAARAPGSAPSATGSDGDQSPVGPGDQGGSAGPGADAADDAPTPPAEASWPGTRPDTGTEGPTRPSPSTRSTGVPPPPSPVNTATTPTPGPTPGPAPAGPTGATPPVGPTGATPTAGPTAAALSAGTPIPVPDPPRRPVPPTWPSPGQPPPGVARRHGRHARPERSGAAVHTPPAGYRPRHAAPDAETEQFAAAPITGPGGVGPMALVPAEPADDAATTGDTRASPTPADGPAAPPARPGDPATAPGPDATAPAAGDGTSLAGHEALDGPAGERVRVVLAERRVPTRAVRTVAEIEQQTETGELLLHNLLRSQLALGLRLGLVAVFVLGALPVLFLVLPRVGALDIAGLRVPWLVLGVAPYPFMLALAWLYIRTAEHNECDFAENVED